MSEVEITTDGSCLGNPGPGGWACILRYGQHERVLQGSVEIGRASCRERVCSTV